MTPISGDESTPSSSAPDTPDGTHHDQRIVALILALAAAIQLFYVLTLPISLPIDSFEYINHAATPFSPSANVVRTAGYPLLVALTAVPWLDSALVLVAVQMLFAIALPAVAFYAVRPSCRAAALTAAALALLFQYPFTMALQVMSETAYLFGYMLSMALLAIFIRRGTYAWLFATLAAIGVTAEVRPAANLLYATIPFVLIARVIQTRDRHTIRQCAIGVTLAITMIAGRGFITDRNSGNIAPFFVWHWMAKCELPDGRSCVSSANGPATARLFEEVRRMLRERRDVYDAMASTRDIRGAPAGVRPEFREYNDASIDRLVRDLQTNTQENSHRGPAMVLALWSHLGLDRTGTLMRPVVLETLMANGDVGRQVLRRFLRALFIDGNMVSTEDGLYVLHDNVYWFFVPSSLADRSRLDSFPGGASLYAEWIDGLARRTGTDPAAKTEYGRVPESWAETSLALDRHDNRSALALYVGGLLTRETVKYVCLASLVLAPFALASAQPLFAVAALLTFWALILTSFFSQNTYRQILMHAPGLFFVVALGVEGIRRLASEALRRHGLIAP